MANEIKQIKVGDTTYNIEPYTSYLPLAGGKMTGNLQMTENSTSILLRSGSDTWYSGIYANSSGDEVLGIVAVNPRTHIMLGNANPLDRPEATSLTPAIDIKNGKVGINKRLGTDGAADAGSYELDVNGAIRGNTLTVSKAESGQDSLIRSVSTQTATDTDQVWRGRIIAGSKNKTFLLGVYKNMCGIGAHSWTDALAASDAAWTDIYFNPDGGAKIYLGGSGWTKDSGVMKIENAVKGAYINVSSLTSPIWRKISYQINHAGDNDNNDSVAGAYSYVIGCGTAGDESMVWTDSSDASAGERSVLIGGYSDMDPFAGDDSVVIGNSAGGAEGVVIIGSFATAGSECVSVGAGAQTTGTRSVGIGHGNKISGSYSVGVGGSAIAGGYNTALGYSTLVTGSTSTVIGYNEDSYGNYNTAIGAGTTVTGTGNVIAGYSNGTSGSYNVVLGYSTHGSSSSYGIAVGYGAYSYNNYNIAIGSSARAGNHSTTATNIKTGQIAIGASADVTAGACGSIVIGEAAYVATNSNLQGQQLVIGRKSYAYSANTGDSSWNYNTGQIVIGHCIRAAGDGCIVIGNGKYNNTSSYYPYASGLNSIAIGSADAWSSQTVNGARALGNYCIAVGMGSFATGSSAIAIGINTTASSTAAIALGQGSKATGSYSVAIGAGVGAGVSGSKGLVCIGHSSNNYRYYGGTATTWSSGSDIRDKTDIEPLTGGVDLIKAIQPIIYRENPRDVYSETGSLFDYDKDEHAKATKAGFKYLASFKAQEVAKYMEDNYGDESFNNIIDHERWYDDVNDENIDRYFMAYGDLVPFMFQAIKEQQEVIEEQEERINTLENKLNELLKRVD